MGMRAKIARIRRSARDRVRDHSAPSEIRRLLANTDEPIIFDVGANVGGMARKFRKWFPRSTVFCFEPFPATFETLVRNTAGDSRIHCFNFGLADRDGESAFHSNPVAAANSLLPTDEGASTIWGPGILETNEVVTVSLRTIDSFAREHAVPRIDLLKLDVQGAEHLVMSGGEALSRRGGVGVIYAEVITQPAYAGQKRFDEALASYYDHGFDLHNLYTAALTEDGKVQYLDAIFTRDERRAAAA